MEFEYTRVVYIDVDKIFERCCEENRIDADEIREAVLDYREGMDDDDYYAVEGWMIDVVVTKIKERVDKELNA